MAAQHLPQDLAWSSSGYEGLTQKKKTSVWKPFILGKVARKYIKETNKGLGLRLSAQFTQCKQVAAKSFPAWKP